MFHLRGVDDGRLARVVTVDFDVDLCGEPRRDLATVVPSNSWGPHVDLAVIDLGLGPLVEWKLNGMFVEFDHLERSLYGQINPSPPTTNA